MTTSRSELRKNALYVDLVATTFSSVEPDTVNCSIAISGIEDVVELECDWTGLKSIFIYDEKVGRVSIDILGPVFASWSEALKRKITEQFSDLTEWEAAMRKPKGAWDIRLLSDPDLCLDDFRSEN